MRALVSTRGRLPNVSITGHVVSRSAVLAATLTPAGPGGHWYTRATQAGGN